jgi:hypothetical protein
MFWNHKYHTMVIYVVVDHCIVVVYVWMSAIVLLLLCACFRNLLVRERCTLVFFFFVDKVLIFLAVVGLPAPHRVATAPTRHNPASLTPSPP